jgi:hypothetical protein
MQTTGVNGTGKGTICGGKATVTSIARPRSPNDNATVRNAPGMLPDRVKIDALKTVFETTQI